jgi:tRNA threonylcarbamoyladenosine biosynthesis protein TsaB
MNILAIDFSSKLASAAVFSDGRRVAMVTSESLVWKGVESGDSDGKPGKLAGASALLTPLVHATIEKSGLKPSDFQLIALPLGPGLFTGLRVAVVTAKTFAYATGAEVIGLNTLEVLAAKAHAANRTHAGPIRVAVNAQRQQLFAGQYQSNREFQIADQGDWDCDAASVAQVATKHYENGRRDDLWNLEPLYFRPSAAEENRMARHSARNK